MRSCGIEDSQPCTRYCGDRPGLCEITWRLWPDDSDVVAVVLGPSDGTMAGWCWINAAHATSAVRPLVRAWAVSAIWRGVTVRTMHRSQLRELVGARVGRQR